LTFFILKIIPVLPTGDHGKKMAYDILENEMPIGVNVLFLEYFLLRVLKLSKQSSKYTTNLDEGFCVNGNFMKGGKRKTDDSSNLQNIKYYIQCAHRPMMGARPPTHNACYWNK
jgi:hypothetical protein